MRKLLLLSAAVLWATPAAAAPRVMASIVPIHSIVAAVMAGQGEPELILKGTMSEHTSGLSPQQLVELGQADLVFMTAPSLEVKLGQLSGSETVGGKTFTMLAEAPGVTRLPLREDGTWEHDADAPVEAGAAQPGIATYNAHVWLDPENAKAMAAEIAKDLSAADPAHAADYTANAKQFTASLDGVESEITALLAPVKDKPFIVFHDAYPYFEKRFGLNAVGSISDASATAPSAKRIGEIRAKIESSGAVCVFREPQFDSRFSDTVAEGTGARPGVLDAVGATLTPGSQAYTELLQNLAQSLQSCLSGN